MNMIQNSVFLLLAFASVSAATNEVPLSLLERAHIAMEEGEYIQALQYAELSIIAEPGAAAYNTLGLAQEGMGDLEGAIENYTFALRHQPKVTEFLRILANLTRAKVRSFLIGYRIHATCVFAALLASLFVWRFMRWISRACLLLRYRNVKVKRVDWYVDNKPIPSHSNIQLFPGTSDLRVGVSLRIPRRIDIFPMKVVLTIPGTNGKGSTCLEKTITPNAVTNSSTRLDYHIGQDLLEDILATPGRLLISVQLVATQGVLFYQDMTVVSEEMLIDDLRVAETGLFVTKGEKSVVTNEVVDDADSVCVYVKLEPKFFPICRYEEISVHIELAQSGASFALAEMDASVDHSQGSLDIMVEHAIKQSMMDRDRGEWAFHFTVGRRKLAKIPFTLIDSNQAIQRIRTAEIALAGIGSDGRSYSLNGRSYHTPQAIVPLISLEANTPELLTVPVGIMIKVDGNTVCRYDNPMLNLGESWTPGEYQLPDWAQGQRKIELACELTIRDKLVESQRATVYTFDAHLTNNQGQLTNVHDFECDPAELEDVLASIIAR